jgi:CBS domain containing-hemolysin-like protein
MVYMTAFMLILTIAAFLLLLVVAAIRPHHSRLNLFELERRAGLGEKSAEMDLKREKVIGDVLSLQRVVIALLQVVVFVCAELTYGFYFGVLMALIVALLYGSIARFKPIKKLARILYKHIEDTVFSFIHKAPILVRFLRSEPMSSGGHVLKIDSRYELQHLVAESQGVLSAEERKLIVNSLSFGDKRVREVMTPRDEIMSVKKNEFLGPLVLDELSKSGHGKLPVISSDINHIVGILHLEGLLALDSKRSTTAEKAMEAKVYYIHKDQTLEHALTEFLSTRHYMLIVINEARETIGLITLTDVVEALIGREIVDEFQSHDSIRAVAQRKVNHKVSHKRHDES